MDGDGRAQLTPIHRAAMDGFAEEVYQLVQEDASQLNV